jgi:hypothetical protein
VFAGISAINNDNTRQRIIPLAIKNPDLLTNQLSIYYYGEESTDPSPLKPIMSKFLFAVNYP